MKHETTKKLLILVGALLVQKLNFNNGMNMHYIALPYVVSIDFWQHKVQVKVKLKIIL